MNLLQRLLKKLRNSKLEVQIAPTSIKANHSVIIECVVYTECEVSSSEDEDTMKAAVLERFSQFLGQHGIKVSHALISAKPLDANLGG